MRVLVNFFYCVFYVHVYIYIYIYIYNFSSLFCCFLALQCETEFRVQIIRRNSSKYNFCILLFLLTFRQPLLLSAERLFARCFKKGSNSYRNVNSNNNIGPKILNLRLYFVCMYTVVHKNVALYFVYLFANYWPIFKIFSLAHYGQFAYYMCSYDT